MTYSKPVRLASDYIDTHFSDKITLETLSAHIGLSASYLSFQMKKETGLSLMDNINKRSVERSKKLLQIIADKMVCFKEKGLNVTTN